LSLTVTIPSSRMPAFSHFWIRRMMRRSPIRCSRKRISHSWLISSKNDQYEAHLPAVDPDTRLSSISRTKVVVAATRSVWPSGLARATATPPIPRPANSGFRRQACRDAGAPSRPRARPTKSEPLPGAKGTTRRIGLLGNLRSASAGTPASGTTTVAKTPQQNHAGSFKKLRFLSSRPIERSGARKTPHGKPVGCQTKTMHALTQRVCPSRHRDHTSPIVPRRGGIWQLWNQESPQLFKVSDSELG
jgi:hypothetical protein